MKYTAITYISLNGKMVTPGEIIDLDREMGADLEKRGGVMLSADEAYTEEAEYTVEDEAMTIDAEDAIEAAPRRKKGGKR